ncbi:MAG: ABC transporter substrate-binding protein [Alphaproteobacteria bacterium]|nr:ABC transporter substrate-binding protein [Alphaproteobacteria bacterium]
MLVRRTVGLLALIAALAAPMPVLAQDQPIRIVFPFAAGGSGDALTRLIAAKMQEGLRRTVIVENRTGAAGRIGTVAVKNAAPDGNTLLLTPIAPVAVYQHVYPNLDYDPLKDFAPVSHVATFDFAIAVGAQIPAKTLKELVAWVKADPARATFASPAAGALPHFFGVLLGRAAGLELRHAPYRGSAAALPDLIAGHVPMMFTTLSDFVENHKAGRIRILATSGKARSPFVEGIPTFREAGYDIEGSAWYGAFAPARTPKDIVDRYSKIMAAAVQAPDVKQKLLDFGLQPTGTTAAELAAIQKADSERWAPAVKASGFKPAQ